MECYKITLAGKLNESWAEWFNCRELQTIGDQTMLVIDVKDQAALYGILVKVLNLGIPLIGLQRI